MHDSELHAPAVANIDNPGILVTSLCRLFGGADLSISALVIRVAVVGFPGLGWAMTATGIRIAAASKTFSAAFFIAFLLNSRRQAL